MSIADVAGPLLKKAEFQLFFVFTKFANHFKTIDSV